ncbi:NACHT domain protein [Dolichospermum planctonicum CS-1226]|uniref:NACHT domain protein n=1 Tax=Dolichospermum planctonicum CS-1226 TaxID=3021751 RepID=A0ABT5AEB7_9CYAN|nr:NACHT domain protein [Dolichospermum planctonicum]MDB9535632.1 NACHT domain protein [Dolichospermum planctonicum CS-1226]
MNFINPNHIELFLTAIARIFGAAAPIVVNRIRSNPAIIKMLQDFKFDPTEHPPQDFDTIYACAVIKYDESKTEYQWENSNVLAELFLRNAIKKAFYKSFYTGNDKILRQEIYTGVAWQEQDWNTLGEEIKKLNIDLNQELEEFKNIFIDLVRLSGKPLEILSHQKIEEIGKDIQKIKEILNELIASQDKQTSSYTYPPEFQSLITEKIKSFCGRKFVFDAFEKFINDNKKGYFTVIGDAGMGKSTIAAKYVFDHNAICYFNVLVDGNNRPELFLASIRRQLINRYRLTNVENADLSTLLTEATAKLSPNEKLIIIVDALDEVKQEPKENILHLPKTLPDNVYFFLTRRRYEPTQERLYTEGSKKESLDLTDSKYEKENQHDIQEYIRFCLNNDPEHKAGLQTWIKNKHITPDAFVQQLAAKSENNFMYLRYVLPAIAEGKYNDLNLNQLPQGLQDYYQTHWNRMNMNNSSKEMRVMILFILVEIGTPISGEMISEIINKDECHVQDVLDEWIEYLRKQNIDGDRCYSIYHASFLDFLKGKREFKATRKLFTSVNQRIVDYWDRTGMIIKS